MSQGADFETVVGLECHVQLQTASKLFSPAPNRFGDAPNHNVDVVDVGLPGTLPVVNARVAEYAVRLGLALGCQIANTSVFARKHYFYPDLAKGYQISQFERPICEGGAVEIELDDGQRKAIGLTRIHIEEDAGKLTHQPGGDSLVDYNRAGTPLLEVVSEPELRSAKEAMAWFRALRSVVMALGICDGNLSQGSMRVDANISVRQRGAPFGTRTEMKNLNSIRFLGQAIEHEAKRQVAELRAGRSIVQQTRLWDADARCSRAMRSKEEAHDYRYFPDPDLPPLRVTDAEIARIREAMPELPAAKRARFEAMGVSAADARLLCEERAVADYFEAALAVHANAKAIASRVVNDVLPALRSRSDDAELGLTDPSAGPVSARSLALLVKLVDDGTISCKIAKDVFAELLVGDEEDPAVIVEEKGWKVQRDQGALLAIIDELIASHEKEVAQYRAGKTKVLGFFVGRVMKATKGQADPAQTNRLLKERLSSS